MRFRKLLPLALLPATLLGSSALAEYTTTDKPKSTVEEINTLHKTEKGRVEVYKVKLDDKEKVHVEIKVTGNMKTGKSIVFFHGATMCYGGMEFMTPYFPDFKQIYINAPGRGLSECVTNPSSYKYSNAYRAILERLLHNREIETIEALIGYSMGGFDAFVLGIEKASFKSTLPIKRLVILNSTGELSETDPIYQAAMALTPENFDIHNIFPIAFGSQTPESYKKMVEEQYPKINNIPVASSVTDLQITVTTKLNDKLKRMNIPTLFIGCKEDMIVPFERVLATSSILLNSSLISYEGAGHLDLMRLMDGEDGYAAAINNFLKR